MYYFNQYKSTWEPLVPEEYEIDENGHISWLDLRYSVIPEGYELVEKDDHKKKRLEAEIKALENEVDWHTNRGFEAAEKLKEKKKELKVWKGIP